MVFDQSRYLAGRGLGLAQVLGWSEWWLVTLSGCSGYWTDWGVTKDVSLGWSTYWTCCNVGLDVILGWLECWADVGLELTGVPVWFGNWFGRSTGLVGMSGWLVCRIECDI